MRLQGAVREDVSGQQRPTRGAGQVDGQRREVVESGTSTAAPAFSLARNASVAWTTNTSPSPCRPDPIAATLPPTGNPTDPAVGVVRIAVTRLSAGEVAGIVDERPEDRTSFGAIVTLATYEPTSPELWIARRGDGRACFPPPSPAKGSPQNPGREPTSRTSPQVNAQVSNCLENR